MGGIRLSSAHLYGGKGRPHASIDTPDSMRSPGFEYLCMGRLLCKKYEKTRMHKYFLHDDHLSG